MNTASLYALLSAFFSAGNDLIYRKASIINRKTGSLTFYLIASASSGAAALLLTMIVSGGPAGMRFDGKVLFFGTILGVLSFITFILYLNSFSGDNTSVSVVIFRMNMIPSILLAVFFLDEAISFRRGIAILICIASVLLLNNWKLGKLPDMRYLLPSIGAFASGGVLNLVNKIAVKNGCGSFSLISVRFLVVTLLTLAILAVRRSWHVEKKAVKYALSSGLMLVMSIYMILEALKTGDLALVMPIAQLSFILVVIVSIVFFKEKMTRKKIIGVCLAIGSVLLIN